MSLVQSRVIPIASPIIDDECAVAAARVLRSGMLVQGTEVDKFEREFALYIGVKHAVAASSGTAALHIALLAAGIGPGDEVITTPFSFIASANSILFTGARPVFVDIDRDTFNIDPRLIEAGITPRTKAVIPVHLFGRPCALDEILEICRRHHLALIEDACQAHGAEYKGRKAGSFGTGCFSFYPTKNMTTGEGGMITTDDPMVAEKARLLRSHGQSRRYHHTELGYNYRMTDIAAAIGVCQLARLDGFNAARITNAAFLSDALRKIDGLEPPAAAAGIRHVFHQFTVRITKDFGLSRDELINRLLELGVATAVHYPTPIHQQPFYRNLGYSDNLPVAEEAAREVLSLPVHPSLDQDDLERIAEGLAHAQQR